MASLTTAAAADDTADKITVQVRTASSLPAPPARIAKRMAASVATIGENVLIGHRVSEIAEKQVFYEKLIKEVFDRILVGYSVQQVTITPASTTNIVIEVAPWGDVVQDVALEIDFGGISPEFTALIKQDMGDVEEKLSDVLLGLPVESVDWAGGVAKSVIRELLTAQLPEFRTNLEINSGVRTVVKLSLLPQGTVVQDVNVSLHSQTIPNLLLLQVRPALEPVAKSLIGLPAAFIERHSDYFTAKLTAAAAEQQLVRRYGLTVAPSIRAGVSTDLALVVETNKYNIALEGYLDVGRDKDNTSAKLHAGKFVSRQDEVFCEVQFIPGAVTWKFMPGWGRRISSHTVMGIKYNLSDNHDIAWLNQDVGRNLMLRLERSSATGLNEVGVRYKLHDFLSAEYIFSKEENWLRLVGNL